MLYREIIAVCSQIHTKHTNTVCWQNVELLDIKQALRKELLTKWRDCGKWMAVAQGRVSDAEPSVFLRSPKGGGAIGAILLCSGADSANRQRLKSQANN